MEFLIGMLLYSFIAFGTSVFFTGQYYKSYVKNIGPWNESLTDEENLKLEADSRKTWAKLAKIAGTYMGVLWILVIPMEIVAQIFKGVQRASDKMAIEAHDEDFLTKQALLKAQKIQEELEARQKEEFEKALEE